MICVRCDHAIRPDEPYDTHIHHGATLAGCTNHTHRTCPDVDVDAGTGPGKKPDTPAFAK